MNEDETHDGRRRRPLLSPTRSRVRAWLSSPDSSADDERLADFATLRDYFRYAISCFTRAGLAFGHGATNALDEAAFLLLEGLGLPIDALDPFLDARLTGAERERLLGLIEARVATRKPAAYLLNRAYIQGVPFYVDERVIVPRSFIGELLFGGLVGEDGPIGAAEDSSACSIFAPAAARWRFSPRWCFPPRASTRSTSPPTRSRSRGAMSPSTGSPTASTCTRATCSRRSAAAATTSSSPTRPMSRPPAVAAFPPEYCRRAAARPCRRRATASTWCGASCASARASDAGGALICEIGPGRARLEAEFPS